MPWGKANRLMAYKVFISHSARPEDIAFINEILGRVSRLGIQCYMAEHDVQAGVMLNEKLRERIRQSDCVLAFLTRGSINSDWVKWEMSAADGFEKLVIPVVEAGIEIPRFLLGKEYIKFDRYNYAATAQHISQYLLIRQNGLLEPILLCEGMVLDGRNREQACKLAQVAPRFEQWNGRGGSPILFVLSKNLHRRHLTTSERGAIAAEAALLLRAETKKTQGYRRDLIEKTNSSTLPQKGDTSGRAAKLAAKTLKVGQRLVEDALYVKRHAPEEFERIKRGEVTVGEARRRLKEKTPGTHEARRTTAAARRDEGSTDATGRGAAAAGGNEENARLPD